MQYVTDRRNRIVAASVAAVGVVVAAVIGGTAPAYQTENGSGQITYQVDTNGKQRGSGGLTYKGPVAFQTLPNCDTIDTSSTGQLLCGTDATGAGGGFGTGNVTALLGSYVRKLGDTMTGQLASNVAGGVQATVGIKVLQTLSGAHLHAERTLSTSGTLVFQGAASGSSLYLGTSLDGAGLASCSNGVTSKLLYSSATHRFSCGADTDTDTNTTYTAGQGLSLISTTFKTNATLTGSLAAFQTLSGSALKVLNTASFSGAVVLETSLTGATLFGFGLPNGGCSNATTSKLLWDTATGRFSCGSDQNTGGAPIVAGQGLSVLASSVRLNATVTGSTIMAASRLFSSGSIVSLGSISGASLAVMNGASYFRGTLGVGVTSPATLVEISNSTSTATNPMLTITNATSTTTLNPSIQFRNDASPRAMFTLGVKYSLGNSFRISSGGTLGTNDVLIINNRGDVMGGKDNVVWSPDQNGGSPNIGLVKKAGAHTTFAHGNGDTFDIQRSNASNILASNTFTTEFRIQTNGNVDVGGNGNHALLEAYGTMSGAQVTVNSPTATTGSGKLVLYGKKGAKICAADTDGAGQTVIECNNGSCTFRVATGTECNQ